MSKIEPSSNTNAGGNTPENSRPRPSNQGEGSHGKTRSRAPQFGSDRRGPRGGDNSQPRSTHQFAQSPADPDGPPQSGGSATQEPERRKARTDRRRSVSRRS